MNYELHNKNRTPFVSIIVPLYNDEKRIANCISSLLNQSYPSKSFEIIIVDNNSNDRSIDEVIQFPVRLLHEKNIQSSYAARNRGIIEASGQILAFTDSDCTPVPEWVFEGVKALQENDAQLASGNVQFTFSPQKTGAEIYDSLTNMQIEQNITERKVSKTANLFVRTDVFDGIGKFPIVKSGGDVLWTSIATKNGFRLIYTPHAKVFHPARKLGDLMKKQYRVALGQTTIMAGSENSVSKNIWIIMKQLLPTRINSVFQMVKRRRPDTTLLLTVRASVAAYFCSISNFCGNLVTLFNLWRK